MAVRAADGHDERANFDVYGERPNDRILLHNAKGDTTKDFDNALWRIVSENQTPTQNCEIGRQGSLEYMALVVSILSHLITLHSIKYIVPVTITHRRQFAKG